MASVGLRWLLCGLGLWLACVFPAAAKATATVDYQLAPVFADGGLSALAVAIEFRASPGGTTVLTLPEGYGAGKEAWRNLRDLRIAGATSVDAPDPGHRLIR